MKTLEFYQAEYDKGKSLNDLSKEFPEHTRYFFSTRLKLRGVGEALSLNNKLHPRTTSDAAKKKLSDAQKKAHLENRHPGWSHKNQDPTRSSYPERFFRKVLKDYEVSEQLNVGKYFLDFAFVDQKIDLEIDGVQHERPDVKAKDFVRDEYLSRNGWTVYRIKWTDCYHNTQETLRTLEEFLKKHGAIV